MDATPDPHRFATIFAALDAGYALCRMIADEAGRGTDYRFLQVNGLFEGLTGLADPVGRTILELIPDIEPEWIETYARVGLGRETLRFERAAGPLGRHFDVFATPVEPHGSFVVVFRDITDRHLAEVAREQALARAEGLLRELHHRVMNSLGMIGAIVRTEARAAGDEATHAMLRRVSGRIASVAALYRTLAELGSAESVPAERYLGEVARLVAESIGRPDEIAVRCDIAPIEICTAVATPLGLILNELMTNSLKHAFPEGRGGTIHVRLRAEDDRAILEVEDDGQGAPSPEGAAPAGAGVGQSLIEALAQQIGGEMRTRSGPLGTAVVLSLPTRAPVGTSAPRA